MTILLIISINLLVVMAVVQLLIVGLYVVYMRGMPRQESVTDTLNRLPETPRTAVLLCIRGVEEQLARNLRALLEQDYRNYQLHIILDSPEDTASPLVAALATEYGERLVVHHLELTGDSAGLKPLGLAQVCESLLADRSWDAFAFTDADSLQSPSWLSRLLAELFDAGNNGAVTGNRWYSIPRTGSRAGAVIRSLWNLASLPQMHLYRVAWGGSWAISSEVLRRSGLVEAWKTTLFEDTLVQKKLAGLGMRVRTVPGLYSISDDHVSLPTARRWIFRQLLDLRLYHNAFPLVAGHALMSGLIVVLPVFYLVAAIGWRQWLLPLIGILIWISYQVCNLLIWMWIDQAVRPCLSVLQLESGATIKSWSDRIRALAVTQLAYPLAMWQAILARQVTWRGIHYQLQAGRIQRRNYEVYRPSESD